MSVPNEDRKESKINLLDEIIADPVERFLPWETCKLPSQGIYYGDAIPDGVVEVRPMGLQAEKVLSTQRLAQTGQSINYLFKHCVRLPNDFDQLDLLATDRSFLLYYLRGITHGTDYEFAINCSNSDCRASSIHNVNLNEIYNSLQLPNPDIGTEPFKVVLPYMSKVASQKLGKQVDFWVKVKFLRGSDTMAIINKSKSNKRGRRNQKATIDDTIEQNLNLIIVEVMIDPDVHEGAKDRHRIGKFIERLHATDSATIREFIKINTPGIETSIEIDCPECGNDMNVELPITESFFRPKKTGGARK